MLCSSHLLLHFCVYSMDVAALTVNFSPTMIFHRVHAHDFHPSQLNC